MTILIPANDHGQIRIFAVTSPMPEGLQDKSPAALAAAFGTDALNPDFIDVVDIRDLSGLSLTDYLHQGYDLSADAVDEAALRTLDGPAILLMSRATSGQDVTLTLAPGLRHVTTVTDQARVAIPTKIEAASAGGNAPTGKAPPSNAAMSGRVATIALIVMFLLVGLMVWVAS